MTWKGKVSLSIMACILFAIVTIYVWNHQKVFVGNTVKNPDSYILEFEKMHQEDSHVISACKDDVFAVHFRIEKGHADLVIAMDGNTPIYKGNDIETGVFDIIVPEDGEYRITVDAKHAYGYVEVYAKKGGTTNNDD